MNRLVQYSATLSLAGMVAAALFVLGGTSIFPPALAYHEPSHDEVARGRIGVLEYRVWNCENGNDPCESTGTDGVEGPKGPEGPQGPKGDDGSAGFDGPLADLKCFAGNSVRYGATPEGSLGWICDDGSSGPPVTSICPCDVFTDGSLASKGLIETWLRLSINDKCQPRNVEDPQLSDEECALAFVCSLAGPDLTGKRVFTVTAPQTTGNDFQLTYGFKVSDDSCSIEVISDLGSVAETLLWQLRTLGPISGGQVWFNETPEFGPEIQNACKAAISVTADQIAATVGDLLGLDSFECEEVIIPGGGY